ncbi:MAG: AbrB/MazE/SpoVT family DNA-binding domain-containing protein [Verrucomicrobiota bacterium]
MRRVSLFRNGRNQAIRIPREFELEGSEAILRKEGDRLVLEPVPKSLSLLEVLSTLPTLKEGLPDVDEGLPELNDVEL